MTEEKNQSVSSYDFGNSVLTYMPKAQDLITFIVIKEVNDSGWISITTSMYSQHVDTYYAKKRSEKLCRPGLVDNPPQ